MRWTVSVPVWGEWHLNTYINRVLWRHVLMGLEDCHYIIHTDAWSRINEAPAMRRLKKFCEVEYRALPGGIGHRRMTECHADAMKDAEAILFLMPDCMLSVEAFDFVKQSKKNLVVLASLRTLSHPTDELPLHAVELADWSTKHLHPNWKGLIWGSKEGQAMNPTNIYFKNETGFWLHGFHLHPLAAVLDGRKKSICHDTVDGAFVGAFTPEETYIVSDREVAQCEITHPDNGTGSNSWDISNVSAIANFIRPKINDMHQRFFSKRILLSGHFNGMNEHIPTQILESVRG